MKNNVINMLPALLILTVAVFLLGCTSDDENNQSNAINQSNELNQNSPYETYNKFVISSLENNTDDYAARLSKNIDSSDDFAKGDIKFIQWRLSKSEICPYMNFYFSAINNSSECEERAILYETIASLSTDCNLDKENYITLAKSEWQLCNMSWRANALEKTLDFKNYTIANLTINAKNATKMILGMSYIIIDNNSIIGIQNERVTRDWLSGKISKSPFAAPTGSSVHKTFYEELSYNYSELRPDIGWHEGGRLLDLINNSNASAIAFSGTLIKKINGTWYAPDENGIFMFEILSDKVENYPTVRFLADDLALMVDTHGISSIVEQSIRKNVTVAMGCCDSVGKIMAADYLSQRNISVYCPTDNQLYLLLGSSANIIGSAPIKKYSNYAVIGNQSIEIFLNETIIVETTSNPSAMRYYETPDLYFTALKEKTGLNLSLIKISIDDFNGSQELIDSAHLENASIIAARVYNYADYKPLHDWLNESIKNRLVLFHSVSYPYGYLLYQEFPNQTSFGDINPIFK